MNKEKIHKFRRKLGWVVFSWWDGSKCDNFMGVFIHETRLSSVIFHCSRSIFGQIIGNFAFKMLFSSCGMVCIIMDDRNCHGIFGRLLMDKEKELKEHIEKRIQNYVWKVLTGKKLTIEDIGGYSSVGFKNRRW